MTRRRFTLLISARGIVRDAHPFSQRPTPLNRFGGVLLHCDLRLRRIALFLIFVLAAGFAGAAVQKKQQPARKSSSAPKKRSTATAQKKSSAPTARVRSSAKGTKAAARKKTTRRTGTRRTAKKKSVPSWRRGQQGPTPERYREIQQALVDRGYLQGPVPENWGSESVDALKRFQRDQKLEPSGKLDSLSIIALGLGPKRDLASQNGRLPSAQPLPEETR